MSDAALNAFRDSVQAALKRSAAGPESEAARDAFDDVVARGGALLDDPTVQTLTVAAAELDSAARILRRRGMAADALAALGDEFDRWLLAELTTEAQRDARESAHSIGERILGEVRQQPASPSELAERLGVEISQISRAARKLRDTGELVVEQVPGNGRRRLYRVAMHDAGPRRRGGWKAFVERLPSLRAGDVSSDLLPGRVGDALSARGMASVCAAFRHDVESGSYEPTPVYEVDIPKTSGGVRPAAALRFADRLAYAALVERCRAEIEASLTSRRALLWPRGRKSDKQWVKLEGFVSESAETHVLSLDIQSFYESIRHDILAEALERAGCDPVVIFALQEWLGAITPRHKRGLPQGLAASDPLATLVLSPLDQALVAARIRYVRHGDDLRILGSHDEVRDAERLVREQLRLLELTVNDEKTRVLRHDTYMDRRTEVNDAVRQYLKAPDRAEQGVAVIALLDALGADEELSWSWYHRTLSVKEVLSTVGASLQPSDTEALMIVLQEVAEAEENSERLAERFGVRRRAQPETFLIRAGISLLAAAGDAAPADEFKASIVARPEYADVLSTYVEETAPVNPVAVAGLLQRIEATGITYDAQWLRLYSALGKAGMAGEFDDLARSHLASADQGWMRRLPAARFMADRGRLDTAYRTEIVQDAPPALRDDALHIKWPAWAWESKGFASDLARKEGATAAAVIAAAA
ncbi:MAG: reverse transcriptase domain-containing protein [Acidimicrobiaceae bacterium]|nr:reverse transcriptase domain-containing protein [Acidimicrobiaceae bacterium]